MSDGEIIADVDAILFSHTMQNAIVLNIRIVPHTDFVHVPAENSVHPDACMLAEFDVSDQLSGIVDVTRVRKLGSNSFEGADHDQASAFSSSSSAAQ
jgi:hypothetical protein